MKLFRRGVEPAFDELVRRYRASLVNYAGAIAGRDRAEDVVQDSLLKAHRSLSGDQDIEPRPWLYKVVRNTALNDIRDNRKHSHDGLIDSASPMSTPDEIAEQREQLAAVVAAVADLPASQRKALIGHELGGYSHEEIASELDLSTGATKQLIYRARLTLRNGFGALIPFPVIAWLAADTTGMFASGAVAGVAGGGAVAAATGGSSGGGVLAAIAGAGATKLAVVAVVAGGSLAGGIAVEKQGESRPETTQASATEVETASSGNPGTSSGTGGPEGAGPTAEALASTGGDVIRTSGDDSSGKEKGKSEQDSGTTSLDDDGPSDESHSGSGSRPKRERHESGDDDGGTYETSGVDRPRPEDHQGDGGDGREPHYGETSGTDSGSDSDSDSGSSGNSGSGDSGHGSAPKPAPLPVEEPESEDQSSGPGSAEADD